MPQISFKNLKQGCTWFREEKCLKYQCLKKGCEFKFLFPLKNIETELLGKDSESPLTSTEESLVCPKCRSNYFDEIEKVEDKISSVKSVPLEEVDALLKKGYVVKELYAKTATLIKKETKS